MVNSIMVHSYLSALNYRLKDLSSSCKHITALAYALFDFTCYKCLPKYYTSTEMLQQWNRSRQRYVDIIPVDALGSHRRSLTSYVRSYRSGVVFDIRRTSFRDLISKGFRIYRLNLAPSAPTRKCIRVRNNSSVGGNDWLRLFFLLNTILSDE